MDRTVRCRFRLHGCRCPLCLWLSLCGAQGVWSVALGRGPEGVIPWELGLCVLKICVRRDRRTGSEGGGGLLRILIHGGWWHVDFEMERGFVLCSDAGRNSRTKVSNWDRERVGRFERLQAD